MLGEGGATHETSAVSSVALPTAIPVLLVSHGFTRVRDKTRNPPNAVPDNTAAKKYEVDSKDCAIEVDIYRGPGALRDTGRDRFVSR